MNDATSYICHFQEHWSFKNVLKEYSCEGCQLEKLKRRARLELLEQKLEELKAMKVPVQNKIEELKSLNPPTNEPSSLKSFGATLERSSEPSL